MAYLNENTETIDPSALRDVVNTESATIAAGSLVKGSYGAALLPTAISSTVIAVTREDIAAGKRGRAANRGLLPVLAGSGGYSAGDRLMPEANTGKAIPWAASTGNNATVIGIAHTAAAADALGLVEFYGSGAMGQG